MLLGKAETSGLTSLRVSNNTMRRSGKMPWTRSPWRTISRPDSIHGKNALTALTVGVAMHDVQRLRRAVEHVHERAAVVQVLDGAVHALEPRARFLRRRLAAEQREQQQGRSRDGMGGWHRLLQPLLGDDGLGDGRLGRDGLHRCADDVRVHGRPRQPRGELAVVHEVVREPDGGAACAIGRCPAARRSSGQRATSLHLQRRLPQATIRLPGANDGSFNERSAPIATTATVAAIADAEQRPRQALRPPLLARLRLARRSAGQRSRHALPQHRWMRIEQLAAQRGADQACSASRERARRDRVRSVARATHSRRPKARCR